MQIQTVFRAGNSNVVAIPKDLSIRLGLKKGSKVIVEETPDKRMVISKVGNKNKASLITPEFLEWLQAFNKEYGPALDELAKK